MTRRQLTLEVRPAGLQFPDLSRNPQPRPKQISLAERRELWKDRFSRGLPVDVEEARQLDGEYE